MGYKLLISVNPLRGLERGKFQKALIDMKIIKKIAISDKIITSNNIKELATKMYKEYQSHNQSGSRSKILFIFTGSDETQYESENLEIFSDGGIIDNRKIKRIDFTFYTYDGEEKHIDINISHTVSKYSFYGNQIKVSGSDENWVNGIAKSFEDMISNWKPQITWPNQYLGIITLIFSIGFGLIFINVLYFILSSFVEPMPSPPDWIISVRPVILILNYGFGILVGYLPASYITKKIDDIFPYIELTIGPEHLQEEVKKRKYLYKLLSLGIIPLILSIIIELIKLIN